MVLSREAYHLAVTLMGAAAAATAFTLVLHRRTVRATWREAVTCKAVK